MSNIRTYTWQVSYRREHPESVYLLHL